VVSFVGKQAFYMLRNGRMKNMKKQKIISKISQILKKYGTQRTALFGSAARGELTKKSDIDILIDIKKYRPF